MFTVDLLKGRGVPLKTQPADVAIIAAGIAIPFIAAIIMLGIYLHNRIVIPITQREIAAYNQKMQTLSDAVKAQQTFYKEQDSINKTVPEAAVAVKHYIAWSPVIRVIAENMPGAMVLSQLEAKQDFSRMPPAADLQKGGDAVSVKRELGLSVSGSVQASLDEEVKGFRARLLENSVLKAKLQDIPVAQQSGRNEKDTVSYDMRLIFKGGV